MVVLNKALLALLIPTAVLARGISHEKLHKRHGHEEHKPAVGTGTPAPYPTSNNATSPSNSAPSHGVITKISTIDVIPVPVTKSNAESSPSESAKPEGSGEHGGQGGKEVHGGKAGSEGSGNSHPEGSPEECGPATVTVTAPVKTVTVTAPAAGAEAPSATPAKPAEKAHTPTAPEQAPEKPASEQPEKQSKSEAPKPEAPKSEAPKVPEKKVEQPKTEDKHEQPATSDIPKSSPQEAAPKTPKAPEKSAPKKSSGGKKGLLYADLQTVNDMAGHISWGCNWDSSPIPAIGHASGQLKNGMSFVPQLWGPEDVHTSIWAANSKGAEYVMAFNEPNQPLGAGGCGPISPSAAVSPYEQHLKANKDQGQKIISPCVSNDAHEWLDTFISSTSLKPDAVCFHWYGLNLKELQGVVATFADIQSKHNIPELWLTEFALNTDISTSDANELFQWLEDQSGVDKYAYNNNNLERTPGVKAAYCH